MTPYQKTYEVIWADMDPNRHMRHSVYNDYAAQTRVGLFKEYEMSLDEIADLGLGPILFREETKFLREIHLSESITVSCALVSMRRDGARWTFLHEIFKETGEKAAQITVNGAWINLKTRKLGIPPPDMLKVLEQLPRSANFEWASEA